MVLGCRSTEFKYEDEECKDQVSKFCLEEMRQTELTYDRNMIAGAIALVSDLAFECFACDAFGKLQVETRRDSED